MIKRSNCDQIGAWRRQRGVIISVSFGQTQNAAPWGGAAHSMTF
ncbi:hypothetical protein DT23_04990 [Thioclava indica]|uniref:Uncharacterized protein n=1 Tax=Thioclava indica TaxID=1353528 RepID=A0A074JP74_9RHOB|nr:hypothetical protein DT23_04990 [Thioclava indica]